MNDARIKKNVDEIFNDSQLDYPLNMVLASAWMAINYKGENVKILDIEKYSSLASYFLLVSVDNPTQANAILDQISVYLKNSSLKIYAKGRESAHESEWFLLDLGDVIIHLFTKEARGLYALDALWKEADLIQIPESYYYQSHDDKTSSIYLEEGAGEGNYY